MDHCFFGYGSVTVLVTIANLYPSVSFATLPVEVLEFMMWLSSLSLLIVAGLKYGVETVNSDLNQIIK